MHDRVELDLPLTRSRKVSCTMTVWARAGRLADSPYRLVRSAPPLRGCGLDWLSPRWRALAKRSRSEMSASAPFITDLPGGRRVLWDRDRSFARGPWRDAAGTSPSPASALASCPTNSTSNWARGPASAGRRNMTYRPGQSRTIGPSACWSRKPRWTYSKWFGAGRFGRERACSWSRGRTEIPRNVTGGIILSHHSALRIRCAVTGRPGSLSQMIFCHAIPDNISFAARLGMVM
jgi:hypothetical protein